MGALKMNFWFVLVAAMGSAVSGRILETDLFRQTSFTCQGRPTGYYADLETGCKTYHVCDGISHFTYVCPRNTLFRQEGRICDHSYLVRCGEEEETDRYDYEEEILARVAEFKKKLARKEENDGSEEDQTQELTSTEPDWHEEPTEIETTPVTTESPTTPSVETATPATVTQKVDSKEGPVAQTTRKFIKFRLKDPRSLFFIPELNNNSVAIKTGREFVLPLGEDDFMRFRIRKKVSGTFSACPSYCDPRFLLRKMCHPCVVIK